MNTKMKYQAVCLKCGEWKRASYSKCPNCGFQSATGSEEELKSVYLSLERCGQTDERDRYVQELTEFASIIKNGQTIKYDSVTMQRLDAQRRAFRSISFKSAWYAILRLFLPGLLFLAVLSAVVWLLKNGKF